jgi:hypothetical protein
MKIWEASILVYLLKATSAIQNEKVYFESEVGLGAKWLDVDWGYEDPPLAVHFKG